jgi:hypothetical protein
MVSENWMQNDAQMKSWEIYIHIIHYNLDLGGVTTLFLIVYIMIGHRDYIEIQKISGIRNLDSFLCAKLWILQLYMDITLAYIIWFQSS